MGLTSGQQLAFDAYKKGESMFVTGDAGTGKSFLSKTIVRDARAHGKNVLVVAPTGKAARNVDGVTIHSAFRAPIGIIDPEAVFNGKIVDKKNDRSISILELTDLIICDEISMVRYDLFGGILRTLAKFDKNRKGEIQVILFGDFYQLPPVLTDNDGEAYRHLYNNHLFAFEYGGFAKFKKYKLTEKMRTSDENFAMLLDRLRSGDATALAAFNVSKPSKSAITLCARNKQTDAINSKELKKLKNQHTYEAIKLGDVKDDDEFAPEMLVLAPGAHVMFTVNDPDNRWINGTDGVVESCRDDYVTVRLTKMTVVVGTVTQTITRNEIVVVEENGKSKTTCVPKEIGKYTQLPVKLAWAMTIHKSQGITVDEVNIDPTGCFAHGQLYVAISRCKSIEGIHMVSQPLPQHLICEPVVKEFMESSFECSDSTAKIIAVESEPVPVDAEAVIPVPCVRDAIPEERYLSVKEIERMIAAYADQLLREHHIDGIFEGHITTKTDAKRASERKAAKDARAESLRHKISELDSAVQRRLVVQDNNTQSVYHVLRNNASEGITRLSADNVADIIGISKRSVESGLQKLRNAGLISSEGATKTPQIRLAEGLTDTNFSGCLLLERVKKSPTQRQVCSVCPFSECPAHPVEEKMKIHKL